MEHTQGDQNGKTPPGGVRILVNTPSREVVTGVDQHFGLLGLELPDGLERLSRDEVGYVIFTVRINLELKLTEPRKSES